MKAAQPERAQVTTDPQVKQLIDESRSVLEQHKILVSELGGLETELERRARLARRRKEKPQ